MWLTCRYKYGDDLMSVVSIPSDNGTSNWFEVSLEFLWSHRCFSQRLFAVLPGTSVLGPCISFVSSSHCQCHAWRFLAGKGHSVFDDRENAVGRHLAKLFFWVSWNLPPVLWNRNPVCRCHPHSIIISLCLWQTFEQAGTHASWLACILWDGSLSVCIWTTLWDKWEQSANPSIWNQMTTEWALPTGFQFSLERASNVQNKYAELYE